MCDIWVNTLGCGVWGNSTRASEREKRANIALFLDIWEKWGRHIWEKRGVGDVFSPGYS